MVFNYYDANIKNSNSLGTVDLIKVLNAIKNPKPKYLELFNQIKIADENNDIALKQKLKASLYSFTPCVLVEGTRCYDNIKKWTGLLVLDFDHLEIDYAIEFKQALFTEYNYIIACWLSASKHGVRAIISIPECTSVNEFKYYFNAVEKELNIYNGFDPATKNCILPMFLSYDADLLYRENFTTFTKKLIPIERPIVKQFIINDKTPYIEKIIYNQLQKITDAGHPILRATAFLLGGYIAAGYIDQYIATDSIIRMIQSHYYLSKKQDIYIKTAKTMIEKGQSKPVYL